MNDAEVLIKFKGDTSDVEKKTKTLKQTLDGTANKISGAASTLAPLSGIAAGAIAGITTVSVDFEKSMANVQAISGATTEDMEKLSQKAREMGKATVYSASESADALGYMALAGWKTNDMLEGLPGILNLAAAGNTDLAITSDIVTDALTAFGMEAKDSTRLADVMAATMSNSNTTIEMLGESFKYVASISGAMKYSVEDTSLALGLMANSGIKASQAGTALRGMLTRMAKPTDESYAAMNKLGLSLTDAQGNMKPLKTIIIDLQKGMSKLTEAEKAQYAAMLAGKPAMSGVLAIANATEEDMTKLSEAIDTSSGSAQNMADVMNKSTSNQLKIMMSEAAELGIQLGEILLPAIRGIIDGITNVVKWFQTLSPETQKAILTATLIVAALAPVLAIVSNIIKVVGLLSSAISFLAANPIVLIIGAIVAVIAIFATLWNKCEGFRNFFIGMWEGIKNAFWSVVNFFANAIQKIAGFFTGLWNNIVSIFKPDALLNIGKQLIEGLWNGIKSAKDWVLDKVKGIGSSILGAVKGIFGVHSPSREFAIIGEYNMLGLEKGMEDMQPEIQRDIDGMFDLSPSMTGSMNNQYSVGIDNEALTSQLNSIADRINNMEVNLNVKAEEGILVEKVSNGFKDSVKRTGSLPFPIVI